MGYEADRKQGLPRIGCHQGREITEMQSSEQGNTRAESSRTRAPLAIPPLSWPVAPEPQPAPRPTGCTPHYIAFREWLEYSYEPGTGEVTSRVVLSMPPVVTLWREGTAPQGPQDVGAWAVTPQPDGLTYEARQSMRELEVTSGQRISLKLLADRQGGAVTEIWPRLLLHDLDASFTVEEWERTRGQELVKQSILEEARQRQEARAQRQSQSRNATRRKRQKEAKAANKSRP